KLEQLGDLGGLRPAVEFADAHFFAAAQRAVKHAGDGDASEKFAVVEIGDLELQDAGGIAGGARDLVDDGFEKRKQILGIVADFAVGHASARVGVHHRKVQL